MIFSELPRGARFRCRLPESRAPVDCVKLSPSRFRRLDSGKYIKATSRTFRVVLITTTTTKTESNSMSSVLPKDLSPGMRIKFNDDIGTVVANNPAKPSTTHDVNSRIVEVSFEGKTNLEIRLKGSDSMNIVD